MSDITISQTKPNLVFIQIVDEIYAIPADQPTFEEHKLVVARKLERDFEALYEVWVREDDQYVHIDEAWEYCRDNYDPPEYDR